MAPQSPLCSRLREQSELAVAMDPRRRHQRGEAGDIESGGGNEDDPARGGGIEHAVDDHAVEVQDGDEAVT